MGVSKGKVAQKNKFDWDINVLFIDYNPKDLEDIPSELILSSMFVLSQGKKLCE